MPFRIVLSVALLTMLAPDPVAAQAQQPPRYEPNWTSLDSRPIPAWFDDAKFGIFIHWGTYSVPAYAPTGVSVYAKYSEWYWWRLLNEKEEGHQAFKAFHDRVYGPDTKYQDFASRFKAEMFDPDQWADIFKDAGARYVVLTSKHHEGFTLWPSKYSWNWNAVDVGPHRDLAGDLIKAVRAKGLKMGYYYSLYEWFNPTYLNDFPRYVDAHMIPQMKELVTTYEPDILWTDGEWEHTSEEWKAPEFLAWLYNDSPVQDDVVVNDRWGSETRSKHGGVYTTEYELVGGENVAGQIIPHKWEECRGIGGSFGYNRNENLADYSTSEQLVHMLVDIVSRGGNLLLDVGPTADGRIPVIMQQRLHDMGEWLRVNGEAIYGTHPWYGAPKDSLIKYTRKGDALYAVSYTWPKDELVIPVRAVKGAAVTLLGYDEPLTYRQRGHELVVSVPRLTVDEVPTRYAHTFKISGVDLPREMRE
ncbi:MAG TPA: alpha-L-fucosidase [Rhodothermales bacterium]|nr:alpha-L-fucosidase [Rhodothermales bacterium]